MRTTTSVTCPPDPKVVAYHLSRPPAPDLSYLLPTELGFGLLRHILSLSITPDAPMPTRERHQFRLSHKRCAQDEVGSIEDTKSSEEIFTEEDVFRIVENGKVCIPTPNGDGGVDVTQDCSNTRTWATAEKFFQSFGVGQSGDRVIEVAACESEANASGWIKLSEDQREYVAVDGLERRHCGIAMAGW